MTIKLPETFTYMHHTFEISGKRISRYKETGRKLFGQVKWRKSKIYLNPHLKGDVLLSTFAHELWHIAIDRAGLSLEDKDTEKLVDVLSYALIEMAKSNKWFRTIWTKGDTDEN